MDTLIKWPGGKSTEIKHIKTIIPTTFNRYVEPFFGGGALFFHLEPKKAVINDICEELISFYRFIADKRYRNDFEEELKKYVKNWNKVSPCITKFEDPLLNIYEDFRFNVKLEDEIEKEIISLLDNNLDNFNDLFNEEFCIDKDKMELELKKGIVSKLKRMKKVDADNKFTRDEVKKNIETGFRSGFYMNFRDVMNRAKFSQIEISDPKRIANYYFVREFCYGSMFRFNKKGEFNIPYGGMSYNKKNFEEKVNKILSPKVRKLLESTVIENMDFEEFFNKYKFTKDDFVFLDPPYDTTFSEYQENSFTKSDQKRLANCLYDLEAKFILIIKNTDFIYGLYEDNGFNLALFDKNYLYNVRGRNVRDVQHLIVHNLSDNQLKLDTVQ